MTAQELTILRRIAKFTGFIASTKNERAVTKKLIAAGAIWPQRASVLDAAGQLRIVTTYRLTATGQKLVE